MSISIFSFVCYILSFVAYIGYVTFCKIRYKTNMDCISSTYYLNERKWIFTAFIIFISFFLLPTWLEISEDNYTFLPFLSTVCLSVVGLFPKYLGDDRKIHIGSVMISAILSIIWNVVGGIYLPLMMGVIFLLLFKLIFRNKDMTLITEIIAFLNIYLSVLLLII